MIPTVKIRVQDAKNGQKVEIRTRKIDPKQRYIKNTKKHVIFKSGTSLNYRNPKRGFRDFRKCQNVKKYQKITRCFQCNLFDFRKYRDEIGFWYFKLKESINKAGSKTRFVQQK